VERGSVLKTSEDTAHSADSALRHDTEREGGAKLRVWQESCCHQHADTHGVETREGRRKTDRETLRTQRDGLWDGGGL
jgi:hypothetical protein